MNYRHILLKNVNFALELATKAQRESRCSFSRSLTSKIDGVRVNVTLWPLYPWETLDTLFRGGGAR